MNRLFQSRLQSRRLGHGLCSAFSWSCMFVMSLLLFSGCPNGKEPSTQSTSPIPVETAVVVQKEAIIQIRAGGQVEPFTTVSLTSQVGGVLKEVHFREGQDVRQGDLLFTIDSRAYETSLREAEANLARDRAVLKDYQNEAERNRNMLKRGFISEQDYKKFVTNVASQAARVAAGEASVEKARLEVSYCRIRSPITGRTGAIKVSPGNVVRANDDEGLVVIKQLLPCYVSFAVPEKHIAEINHYAAGSLLKVEAAIPGSAGKITHMGELKFIDNAVDKDTGTVLLKALFDNRDRNLWPGQSVDVVLTLATIPNALAVPSRAVQTGPDGSFVFVVKPDKTLEVRTVEVRPAAEGTSLAVKGLKAGDVVVTEGRPDLHPGATVIATEHRPSTAHGKESTGENDQNQPARNPVPPAPQAPPDAAAK